MHKISLLAPHVVKACLAVTLPFSVNMDGLEASPQKATKATVQNRKPGQEYTKRFLVLEQRGGAITSHRIPLSRLPKQKTDQNKLLRRLGKQNLDFKDGSAGPLTGMSVRTQKFYKALDGEVLKGKETIEKQFHFGDLIHSTKLIGPDAAYVKSKQEDAGWGQTIVRTPDGSYNKYGKGDTLTQSPEDANEK